MPGKSLLYDVVSGVIWRLSNRDRALLDRLRSQPFLSDDLPEADRQRVRKLASTGLLLSEIEAWSIGCYDRVSIEINSHCNLRCRFCPVSEAPLPKRFMRDDVYRIVLNRVSQAGIGRICLNHYGEPTLDPMLGEKIALARDMGIGVDLFSNGSSLKTEWLKQWGECGDVCLVVNLPAIDAATYASVTGWKHMDRVLKNIREATSHGVPTQVTINAPTAIGFLERQRLKRRINRLTGVKAVFARVESRAGAMNDSRYAQSPMHHGPLAGCYRMLSKLVVNFEGKLFLCCQDYHQEEILGDLNSSSIEDIMRSDRAVLVRRWIFGAEQAPDDFICRRCEETCSRTNTSVSAAVGKAWLVDTYQSVEVRVL
jgi:hypothetical protein